MIKKILFKNFYSFAEETEISFEIGQKPSKSLYDINFNEERINKVVAIIGANGSGKTQLIRPLAFVSWFISDSYTHLKPEDEIPYKTHRLSEKEISALEINFVIENIEYKYSLNLQNNKVLKEHLYKKTSKFFSYIFKRDRDSQNDTFTYKHKDFDFSPKLANKLKDNASILSAAYMNDSVQAKKFIQYFDKNVIYNVTMTGRTNYSEPELMESAKYFYENQDMKQRMNAIICDLDLGLSGVVINEVDLPTDNANTEKVYLPIGIHESHNGDKFELPFFDESSGTKSLFVQLKRILPILSNGGIAVIDELDNDLHPHMIPTLIDLFKFEHTNPHNAQIIFTCHTPEILNVLKKHQVYLVEKENLKSDTWRLDNMVGLRSDDNLYAKYYAGSLGATPNI